MQYFRKAALCSAYIFSLFNCGSEFAVAQSSGSISGAPFATSTSGPIGIAVSNSAPGSSSTSFNAPVFITPTSGAVNGSWLYGQYSQYSGSLSYAPANQAQWKLVSYSDGSFLIQSYQNPGLCIDSASMTLTNCVQGSLTQRFIAQKAPKEGAGAYLIRSYNNPSQCLNLKKGQENKPMILWGCQQAGSYNDRWVFFNGFNPDNNNTYNLSWYNSNNAAASSNNNYGTVYYSYTPDLTAIGQWADYNAVWVYGNGGAVNSKPGASNNVTIVTALNAVNPIALNPTADGYAVPILGLTNPNNTWYTNGTTATSNLTFTYSFQNTASSSYGFTESGTAQIQKGSSIKTTGDATNSFTKQFSLTFGSNQNWSSSSSYTGTSSIVATVSPNNSIWLAQSQIAQTAYTNWNVITDVGEKWTTSQMYGYSVVPSSTSSGITSCVTNQSPIIPACQNSIPAGLAFNSN